MLHFFECPLVCRPNTKWVLILSFAWVFVKGQTAEDICKLQHRWNKSTQLSSHWTSSACQGVWKAFCPRPWWLVQFGHPHIGWSCMKLDSWTIKKWLQLIKSGRSVDPRINGSAARRPHSAEVACCPFSYQRLTARCMFFFFRLLTCAHPFQRVLPQQ